MIITDKYIWLAKVTAILVYNRFDRPVSSVVKHISIGAEGLGFNYRISQMEHRIAKGSPPLRRVCVAQALSLGDGPHHMSHALA